MKYQVTFSGDTLESLYSDLRRFLTIFQPHVESSVSLLEDEEEKPMTSKKPRGRPKSKPEAPPAAMAPAQAEATIAADPEEVVVHKPVATREVVLELLKKVNIEKGLDAARAVLRQFGVERFGDLKETDYRDFSLACEIHLKAH
jgi:hypothetical protein